MTHGGTSPYITLRTIERQKNCQMTLIRNEIAKARTTIPMYMGDNRTSSINKLFTETLVTVVTTCLYGYYY